VKADIFKLGGYKITQSHTGNLRWEAHFGFGEIEEGRCFKKGSILFIGPMESRRDGFLKFEYMAHLNGFPDWFKTKYYCRGFEVYHCKTGRKVTKKEMQLWNLGVGIHGRGGRYSENSRAPSNDTSVKSAQSHASHRLQRYEITKKPNDNIVWKTHAGPNTFSSGTCIILEDILVMGLQKNEQTRLNKKQFIAYLEQLPEWNQTTYYAPQLSLHECKRENEIPDGKRNWFSEARKPEKHSVGTGHHRDAAFQSNAAELFEKGTQHLTRLAKKWVPVAIGWMFCMISLSWAFLIRLREKIKRKWRKPG